jgi:hypothetical protein
VDGAMGEQWTAWQMRDPCKGSCCTLATLIVPAWKCGLQAATSSDVSREDTNLNMCVLSSNF